MKTVNIFGLYAGGTLGMEKDQATGALVVAKTAAQLVKGLSIPANTKLKLVDFPLRQDSTNMTHADRMEMAAIIQENYDKYDAFIVFQGTDTLDETCAFLSHGWGKSLFKPVFIVGSQLPRGEAGSDASMQMENAFRAAVAFAQNALIGVFTVSQENILHGPRVCKGHHASYTIFKTPGIPPVGKVEGENIWVQENMVRQRQNDLFLDGVHTPPPFEEGVLTLPASANVSAQALAILAESGLFKGIILEAKGAGNIPTRQTHDSKSWVDTIRYVTGMGIYIAIQSPFEEGRVNLSVYGPGQAARNAGALTLGSLTPAMADIKFRTAIALYGNTPNGLEKIQDYLLSNHLEEHLPGKLIS